MSAIGFAPGSRVGVVVSSFSERFAREGNNHECRPVDISSY